MKEITKIMVEKYNLKKLKLDMMGFKYGNIKDLSFHHLIIRKSQCKEAGLGDGYLEWNGAILEQDTSHDLLHFIERIDPDLFCYITSEIIDIKAMQKLDKQTLMIIHGLLDSFIKEHDRDRSSSNKLFIPHKAIEHKEKGHYLVKNM